MTVNVDFNEFDSTEINTADKNHHTHPWQLLDVFPEEGALPIAAAEGAYIYDTDGNKYLDAVGGLWCTNIGLGRDEMVEAIAEQTKKMAYASAFVDLTNVPAATLAKKLAELAPGDLNHTMFTCGGSTAVDTAYRLIQFYQNCRGLHEKKHILSRINSYHGTTYAAMSIGGKPGDHPEEFDFIRDTIHHLSSPNYYRAPQGMNEADFLDSLIEEMEDKINELGADKVAAFFAEPILGAGGVIVPPKGYQRRTWELCQKHDILYVSDEVVTAFGRLGEWFTSKTLFDIQPDIIISAKGITSGYQPLGACIYSSRIHKVIAKADSGRCFANGYTYSAHPVACAAALKNIEIMERENLLSHVKELGPYFQQQVATLKDLPIVGDVRGSHLMVCVEMVQDKETKALFPDELDIGKCVANHADALGLIVRPIVNLNVMSPPLVIDRDDVDFIVNTLRKAIEATMKDMEEQGKWQRPDKAA
ncbi:aminotransferase [Porticoccus sp. W117]|uniref:aminotransferase n=1 Tax=Porticoccus sp. W117 TaxID=3054777 RepID=UPI002599BEA9|nr:aminotransferase [Porticoccus sp. W117]MDM3871596.1 aminotransferase [Porticoccus sp. W117]